MRKAITRDCSTTARAIQSMSITANLRLRKNWQEVEKNIKKVGNVKALSNEKVKQKKVLKPDGVGFKAIKELKAYTDLQDPFLIPNINDSQQSIFKTSTSKMKIALEMYFEGDHFLKDEYCHFDGNHKRVREFVTLTASVYHPLLRKQLVLATMNCKHGDSNYVVEFCRKFNEAFRKADKTKKHFWPWGWVTDMASAKYNGLDIGEDIHSRVKGCKFRFKQSVERISRTLGQKREEFKNLALNMLTSSTPEAYSHAIIVLKIFSKDNADNVKHWTEWWDAQKENIFQAFTSFDAPQSNQAKAVHAGWKNRDKMGVSLFEC